MYLEIIVPITPITKKNSQRIIYAKGRPMVIPSAQYTAYEKECAWFMPKLTKPINIPVNVKCLYYMPTRRVCDVVNHLEATLDILVKYGVLEDDNYKIVASMDGSRVLYDKENPRTEITITDNERESPRF